MPLGYVPGSHRGLRSALSHRLFGSRKFSRTIEYRIIRRWLPGQPVKVLDIGAGVCELAAQLALMGYQVTALDFEPYALQEGRTLDVPRFDLVAGDATRLPFENASFDLIICNSALEHFPDDDQAISEIARVVREGGRVVVTTDSFPPRVSAWLKWIPYSWRSQGLHNTGDLSADMQDYHRKNHRVVTYYQKEQLARKLQKPCLQVEDWCYYLNDHVSKAIYELHIILKRLDFYNKLSRRLFPLFWPFTFFGQSPRPGYGLAIKAVKTSGR